MRITNSMTNRIAKEAGLPIYSSSSLLEQMNQGTKISWKEDFSSTGINVLKENRYKELEEKADRLAVLAEHFTSGNLKNFVDGFNDMMSSLKGTSSALNDYYRQMMKDSTEESEEALGKLGITLSGNGTLSFDKSVLEKLDNSQQKEALDGAGLFSRKITFLAGRIANNARANAESLNSRYDASGNVFSDAASKFDLWG